MKNSPHPIFSLYFGFFEFLFLFAKWSPKNSLRRSLGNESLGIFHSSFFYFWILHRASCPDSSSQFFQFFCLIFPYMLPMHLCALMKCQKKHWSYDYIWLYQGSFFVLYYHNLINSLKLKFRKCGTYSRTKRRNINVPFRSFYLRLNCKSGHPWKDASCIYHEHTETTSSITSRVLLDWTDSLSRTAACFTEGQLDAVKKSSNRAQMQ